MNEPVLSIEEEILAQAGLLDYEPIEEGEPPLDGAQRKERLDEAREDFLALAGRVSKIDWAGGQKWESGADMPIDKNYKIWGMFGSLREEGLQVDGSSGDIRIYVHPKQSLPGDSFKRITLNRISPGAVYESLTRETFIRELGKELAVLIELNDEEVDECPSCEAEVKPDHLFCPQCGTELPDEETEAEKEPPASSPQPIVPAS